MTNSLLRDGRIALPQPDFEQLLEDAATRGARRALADVGLDGDTAAEDIRELRGLLEAFHSARQTAWLTVVKGLTTGLLIALLTGAAIKLKLFGGASP